MDFEEGLSLKKGEETSVPSVSDDSRNSSVWRINDCGGE